MGVSETELFRTADAAFKQGAQFARWTTGADDDAYYHPLMLPQSFAQLNLVPHWLASGDGESFCDAVCPQGRLCEDGLAPKTIATPEYEALANYAYHLDAGDRSEEHTSEIQSLMRISYAVFCLKKKQLSSQPRTYTDGDKVTYTY